MSNEPGVKALKTGKELCDEVYEQRVRILRERAQALAGENTLAREEIDFSRMSEAELLHLTAASKAIVLGVGDSWFDYFSIDVFDALYDYCGYNAISVAQHGMSLESIVAAPSQLNDLSREIEKTVGKAAPKAILVSGGGNDFVDFGIEKLLRDFASGPPRLVDGKVSELVDGHIKPALTAILDSVMGLCQRWLGKTVPILIHGYAYPIPDGSFLSFPPPPRGPWLWPAFKLRHYVEGDLGPRTEVMKALIDSLNKMQIDLVGTPPYSPYVTHVDLRHALDVPNYKTMWENELHPNPKGFQVIARQFDTAIKNLP